MPGMPPVRHRSAKAGVGNARVNSAKEFLEAFRVQRMAGQVMLQVVREGKAYYARIVL